MPSTEAELWLLAGLIGLFTLLASERRSFRPGIVAGKLTASTAFVVFAHSLGALETTIGQLVFAGMLFCWSGDALLLAAGHSIGFRLGIGAFLLGHLTYGAAFWSWGVDWLALGSAALGVAVIGWRVLRWLLPHVPTEFVVPIRCYVVVIGMMVACAVGASADRAPHVVAAGAIAFAISDLSVARERFVQPSFANSLWGLPLYYLSQIALASALMRL